MAPGAGRIAISFRRDADLAKSRLATLAHAISKTKLTAPSSTSKARRTLPTTFSCKGSMVTSRLLFVPGYCCSRLARLAMAPGFGADKKDKEQEKRFKARIEDPLRQWKLSPMDLPSRSRWYDYSRARDVMFKATDTKHAPWVILRSDDKKRARLNCIRHLLDMIPYKKLPREKIDLPKRSSKGEYDDQATLRGRKFVPEKY